MILEDITQHAIRSYSGTSFDPEKRGAADIKSYSEELETDLISIPEDERERYTLNYRSKLSEYFSSQSRVMSTMITGPSNFPVARNQKRSQSADNKYTVFREWREHTLKHIKKKVLNGRSEEEKLNDEWTPVKKKIISAAATIVAIDQGIERGYTRALFVNVITNVVKRLAKNADVVNLNRSLELIKHLNSLQEKPIIADKNGIWKLEEAAEVAREKIVDNAQRENEEETINNVRMVTNFSEDRVQLLFDGKPSPEIITRLKKNAWRWSPTNQSWQRKLTNSAIYDARNLLRTLEIDNS